MMRAWMSSLVGSVHTQRWVPVSTRMISALGSCLTAFSLCSGCTSESAVPCTSSVGVEMLDNPRSPILGNWVWSLFRPSWRPEMVADTARTKLRLISSFQMCSVSACACSLVRSPSSEHPEQSENAVKQLPNAEIIRVDTGTHLCVWTDPTSDDIQARIIAHLNS